MKKCLKCGFEKDITAFTSDKLKKDSLDDWCRSCKKMKRQEYYAKNKEQELRKVREYQDAHRLKIGQQRRIYYQTNVEVQRQKSRDYYFANREECNRKHVVYCKNRYHNDSLYRLRVNVTNSVNSALRKNSGGKRGLSCMRFLPYSISDLYAHLEKQFSDWMSWENYGVYEDGVRKWNIDHYSPDCFRVFFCRLCRIYQLLGAL
jgi:hypothetical protein